jgi:hypothetical protein
VAPPMLGYKKVPFEVMHTGKFYHELLRKEMPEELKV